MPVIAVIPSNRRASPDRSGYVHKLRLEAREGAAVEVNAPALASNDGLGRVFAKFIGAVLVVSTTVAVAATVLPA
ncbi:hypothetical protein HNQ60_001742 [Povalibacter uvarum]|uniref:Uncharacterized protein n=1 Tax=Povalibacter uvarum TaxID=732238 RepID=A0A841HJV3_9GAMM|nr:hypothetical protein [Povalibacter uvarum]MBB6092864.1 hypothetical protein [Povalibacter uvarum]